MSGTSKARLQAAKAHLDGLFANAHTDDRLELVKELRDYLTLQRSAANRPAYEAHSNSATGTGLTTTPKTNA